MTCEYSAKLDRYVDSELPLEELREFEQHLRGCADCAASALERLQTKRAVQAAGRRFSPAPEFRLKVAHSIAPRPRRAWFPQWAPAIAAAVAIAVTVSAAALWMRNASRDQTLSELADLHVSTLASANPVDVVSSDRHTVKPWFQSKLPFTFNLPELGGSPFTLAGGRLAYFHQSPGAQLLFTAGKHRISVFLFQDRGELSRLTAASSSRGDLTFAGETWNEGGIRYYIVGDAGRADIETLSGLLKAAAR